MLSFITPDGIANPLPVWSYPLLLFLTWYTFTAFTTWYRLRHVPGPFLASFSYAWYVYQALTGRIGPAFQSLNRYGPLVRTAPNYVVTSDPEVLRRIGSARSKWVRDDWYKAARFHSEYDNMATIIDNDEHDRMKAKTASAYSGREDGAGLEPAVDEQIVRLKGLITRKLLSPAAGGSEVVKPVDVSRLMRFFTLDVITRLGYGKPFGYLDEGTDVYGWIEMIDKRVLIISLPLEVPLLRRIMFSPYGIEKFGPQITDKTGVGKVMGIVNKIVTERFQSGEKHNDMIGGFIRNGMSQQEVEGEALLQLFAGSDTTANALTAAVVSLATAPRAYARLKHEIRDAIKSGHVDAHQPITLEQAQKLPYLQAVIYESFRIRNPVNHGHYKLVPPPGETFHGIYLPPGTAVGHNTLALTRNRAIFGHDADVYRPERFFRTEYKPGMTYDEIELDTDRIKALDIVFGGGRWTCSGKHVAMVELNKVIFELMRDFDFQFVDPQKGWDEVHYLVPRFKNLRMFITETEE